MILSRNAAIPVLSAVIVAPITRTIRDIASELSLGKAEGLPEECVANCDNVLTVPKDILDAEPVGEIGVDKIPGLDRALRFALEISF
jgi:mRNA interferase MazF